MTTSISMLYFCAKKNDLLCFKTNTCTSTSTITTSSSSSDRWWSQSQSQRKMSLVPPHTSNCLSSLAFQSCTKRWRRRRRSRHIFRLLSPNAKKRRRAWWHNILSDNDDVLWSDWSGADDVLSNEYDDAGNEDEELSEADKFESWKRRAEAISELRDAQQSAASAEGRQWEDWLSDGSSSNTGTSSWDPEDGQPVENDDTYRVLRDDKGLVQSVKNLFMRLNDEDYDDSTADSDEFLFEDRVFQYASTSSAKFIALLILIPWALDFLFHDYIFMPFLDRYVKLVPLAAEMLDVRRHQKLEMVNTLKVERARFQLEVEIGRSPPLSDDEIWLELRHKAIELRDEWRLENRRAFANIWSDMVYGISLFILIYSNKGKVALLKFTGYKLINNISDTGKAFLIILITDIFLGYHSESGWQALVEIIVEHYGLQVDPAAITIFICFVPVVIDACVKIWLFKYLPRLSPNVANIFREMKRH